MRRWGTLVISIISFGAVAVQAAWPIISGDTQLSERFAIEPSIAVARSSIFVTWAEQVAEPQPDYVYEGLGHRLAASGERFSAGPVLISPSPIDFANLNTAFTVASDGSGFVMMRLEGGKAYSWFTNGSKRERKPQLLPAPVGTEYGVSGVGLAGGPSGYVGAWTVARVHRTYPFYIDYVVACLRMDKRGRPLMTNAVILNPTAHYSFFPRVASCRDRFLVLWQNGNSMQAVVLHETNISNPLLPFQNGIFPTRAFSPSVAADEETFGAAWIGATGQLQLIRFDLSGAVLATNQLHIGSVEQPGLVNVPGGWLLTFTADPFTTAPSIRGLRLSPDLLPEGEAFLIEEQVGRSGKAVTARMRNDDVLAVIERRPAETNSAVIVRRISFPKSSL